jgi:hypothetical protein
VTLLSRCLFSNYGHLPLKPWGRVASSGQFNLRCAVMLRNSGILTLADRRNSSIDTNRDVWARSKTLMVSNMFPI